jgi:micrococcal nuclease
VKSVSAFAKEGALALMLGTLLTATAPATARAATCDDHPDQASAQSAKDTRDGDGDGIFCESLPCPCLAPDPRASSTGDKQRGESGRRAQRFNARITDVIDGDTVKVRAYGARRRHYTVRLIGIDTPETKRPGVAIECGGPQATSNMYRLAFRAPRDRDGDGRFDDGAKGRRVVLRTDPTQDTFDRYGRLLAYVRTRAGVSLQKRQLRAGLAEVYVYRGNPFRQVGAFRRAERSARRGDRGVWDRCDGDFHRS